MQVLLHLLDSVELLQLVVGQLRREGGSERVCVCVCEYVRVCVCCSHLDDDVSQQPQVAVPHGPRAHQDLTVVAVVPFVVDGHDDPAETTHRLPV